MNAKGVLNPTLFPALKFILIREDNNLSNTFSTLFLSPELSGNLKVLGFVECNITTQFLQDLTQFVSKRRSDPSVRLDHVIIIHKKEELKKDILDLIEQLRAHVGDHAQGNGENNVEKIVWADKEWPSYLSHGANTMW